MNIKTQQQIEGCNKEKARLLLLIGIIDGKISYFKNRDKRVLYPKDRAEITKLMRTIGVKLGVPTENIRNRVKVSFGNLNEITYGELDTLKDEINSYYISSIPNTDVCDLHIHSSVSKPK